MLSTILMVLRVHRYCLTVTILALVYSAFQLFKGICDIAHRGILISDQISDYTSFILDQV